MQRDGDHVPFVTSGSYPVRGGNAVEPLVDGVPAFRRICEAVARARRSVWVTVAFHQASFAFPDAHGSLIDLLDRAQARGLDVRVIFWRHRLYEQVDPGKHYAGTEAQRAELDVRGSRWLARWDQADGNYCQHQKSWLVDAGTEHEIAFVGGINLEPGSVVAPGHAGMDGENVHDVYLQLRGPAASDVHHNFVQRWNEASDKHEPDGTWPGLEHQDELHFPRLASAPCGEAVVQIQRTVRRGRYRDGTPAPGGSAFAIEAGEHSILDQYLQAIASAQRTIYIEDQAIGSAQVVDVLHAALERGVDVVFVAPADPNRQMAEARKNPTTKPFFDSIAALGRHPHFALAGIGLRHPTGVFQNVYVHAKVALIDDQWCTIGSTNIANRSFYGDTELNASIWHSPTVRALRCELFHEHLAEDTSALDDRAALERFRAVARENASVRSTGGAVRGLAFALDPATYGE